MSDGGPTAWRPLKDRMDDLEEILLRMVADVERLIDKVSYTHARVRLLEDKVSGRGVDKISED